MWIIRTARGRRAVLFALTSAGPLGMTICALGMAADLPESDLQLLLSGLIAKGQVRQLSVATTARYQCTRESLSRRLARLDRRTGAAMPSFAQPRAPMYSGKA